MAADYSPQVLGFPPPPPPGPTDYPPAEGAYAVPHPWVFASVYNQGTEVYRWTHDEALRHSVQNMLAMRRDPVIMAALESRQRPTALLSWHVEPEDETHSDEAEAAAACTKLIERIRDPAWWRVNLLEALWYGRAACQMRYAWEFPRGEKRLTPGDWLPVNGDKVRFKWDGTAGITVHAQYPGKKEVTDFNFVHYLTPSERQQFVVHKHKPEDADWREGEFADQIHGVGIRSRLYWWWWLKQQFLGLLSNYMQRFANGLTVITFDAHNKDASAWAEQAARTPWSVAAFKIPQWDSTKPNVNSVQRIEVGTTTPQLLQVLITDYFDSKIKEYILGQNLTSETAPTGLGSGVAEAHEATLETIIKFDAGALESTIQYDLVNMLYRWNWKGIRPGKFSFEIDNPDAQEVMENAQIAYQLGMALDEEQIREVTKLAKPKPGKPVLSPVQAMQPAAVTAPGPDAMPQVPPVGPGMPSANGAPPGAAMAGQPTEQPLAFTRNRVLLRQLTRRKITPEQRARIRKRIRARQKAGNRSGWPEPPKGWKGTAAAYWTAAADL